MPDSTDYWAIAAAILFLATLSVNQWFREGRLKPYVNGLLAFACSVSWIVWAARTGLEWPLAAAVVFFVAGLTAAFILQEGRFMITLVIVFMALAGFSVLIMVCQVASTGGV